MTAKGEGKTITIDLTERLDVRSLKIGEFIHIDALTQLISNIDEIIAKQAPEKGVKYSEFITNRRHETITIQGSRGSGKTTFIRNALDWLNSSSGDFDKISNFDDVSKKVVPLSVIDPTLIENKENFLVLVLSEIKTKVEKYNDSKGLMADGRPNKGMRDWYEKLKNLAKGLSLLDGIGSESHMGEAWDDANYILEKGLNQATNSVSLERNFHEFILESLKIVGEDKKAFILAIDDVDTDFRRGWPVLETLRRYLTSPNLIVILSGDMELYSMLVRNQVWKNFDKQFLDRDPMVPEKHIGRDSTNNDRSNNILTMVSHIQGQYLLKVLPTSKRIELPILKVITEKSTIAIIRNKDDSELWRTKPEDLLKFDDVLGDFIKNALGVYILEDIKSCRDFILRQPTRTVLQMMAAYFGSIESGSDFPNILGAMFVDVLARQNISVSSFNSSQGKELLILLIDYLQENNLWADGHTFFVNHKDEDSNITSFTLGVKLFHEMQGSLGLQLQYGLLVCVTRELFESNIINDVSKGEVVSYLRLENNEKPIQIVRRMSSIWNNSFIMPTTKNTKAIRFGVVRLSRRPRRSEVLRIYGIAKSTSDWSAASKTILELENKPSEIATYHLKIKEKYVQSGKDPLFLRNNWFNNIEHLGDAINGECRHLLLFPYSKIMRGKSEGVSFYSIYNLIASIAHLISIGGKSKVVNEKDIRAGVEYLAEVRTYPAPPWDGKYASIEANPDDKVKEAKNSDDLSDDDGYEEDGNDEDVITKNNTDNDPLISAITDWVNKVCKIDTPKLSPKSIAAMWTRLHYTLESISNFTHEKMYLGLLTHRMIVAFFNAILIEEMRTAELMPHLKNPINSDREFITNLNRIEENYKDNDKYKYKYEDKDEYISNELPLFYAIFTCPVWGAFLQTRVNNKTSEADKTAWEKFREYSKIDHDIYRITYTPTGLHEALRFDNLYDILNSVTTINLNANPKNLDATPKQRKRGRPPGTKNSDNG